MDVKGKVLLQFFNKSKLRNGTNTYLEQHFFSVYSQFKKLGFSAPLSNLFLCSTPWSQCSWLLWKRSLAYFFMFITL